MNANIEFNGLDEMLDRIERATSVIKNAENVCNTVLMLNVDKVAEITGWNRQTVDRMFNRPDFPAQCFGKSRLVEISALKKFFEVRHDREGARR